MVLTYNILTKEPVTRVRLTTRFSSYNFVKEIALLLFQGEGAIFCGLKLVCLRKILEDGGRNII